MSAALHRAVADLGEPPAFVVYPGEEEYSTSGVRVVGLGAFLARLRSGRLA